jgi:purine-nucleoside/S-methyl-5'-thioadenosine phosphorylase / adenosine deaminase
LTCQGNPLQPLCYIRSLGRQAFQIVSRQGLAWLECRKLSRLGWVLHAFSTRQGGSGAGLPEGLNLGFTASDQRELVLENRRFFFTQLGAEHFALASLRQVHSAQIHQVIWGAGQNLQYCPGEVSARDGPAGRTDAAPRPAGDALITDQPGILLSVLVADCLPVLLVDPQHRVLAAIHAGWRGTLARIVEKTPSEMQRLFRSRPESLLAVLGPSIRACCYEVGEEVVEAFQRSFARAQNFLAKPQRSPGESKQGVAAARADLQASGQTLTSVPATHLDLVAAAREQLLSAGLLPAHMHVADFCTACRTDLFFSHRKEGSGAGRAMAVIGIPLGTRPGRGGSW